MMVFGLPRLWRGSWFLVCFSVSGSLFSVHRSPFTTIPYHPRSDAVEQSPYPHNHTS